MLFSEKYPNANSSVIYKCNYIYTSKPGKCCMCGRLTHFIEINAEDFFCSEECDEKFYNEIFKK